MRRERRIAYRPFRAKKAQSVRDYFFVRGKEGAYRQNLRRAFHGFRREPTWTHMRVCGVHLLRLLLGDRLMSAVLADRAVVVTGEYGRAEQSPGVDVLYHFAPNDCVDTILSHGMLPRRQFVYLTDSPAYTEQVFLQWKTEQLRATTTFTLLEVDARRLKENQKIFCTDREHEFVTGKIDAKYISVVTDDPSSV